MNVMRWDIARARPEPLPIVEEIACWVRRFDRPQRAHLMRLVLEPRTVKAEETSEQVVMPEPDVDAGLAYRGEKMAEFSDVLDAFAYGLALLVPYAPLLQLLEQGATPLGIAPHYHVSVEAVEM